MTLRGGDLGEGNLPPAAPEPVDAVDRPRVGVDDWVAQAEERRAARTGFTGLVVTAWSR